METGIRESADAEEEEKVNAPYKNCEKRKLGCHARCEIYQEFTEERKQVREWLNKKNWSIKKRRKAF